jgi:hypothetical protein
MDAWRIGESPMTAFGTGKALALPLVLIGWVE